MQPAQLIDGAFMEGPCALPSFARPVMVPHLHSIKHCFYIHDAVPALQPCLPSCFTDTSAAVTLLLVSCMSAPDSFLLRYSDCEPSSAAKCIGANSCCLFHAGSLSTAAAGQPGARLQRRRPPCSIAAEWHLPLPAAAPAAPAAVAAAVI